jgi:PAS domain S-box-containing protein
MSKPLRLLIVDDSSDDASLLLHTLRTKGYEVTFNVVNTPSGMCSELETHKWDIIISDHKTPGFNAQAALKLAKELRPDLPFIIVSDEIDLDLAVSLMQGGAKDYILKHEIKRLVPVIERELHEVEVKRERQAANAMVQESETRYRRLFEAAQDGILILDADTGMVIDVNPFLINMLGYSREEFLGKKLWELGAFKDKEASKLAYTELQTNGYIRYNNLPLQAEDGRHVAVEFVSNVYLVNQIRIAQCNIRDITEREMTLNEQKRLQAEIILARDFYLTLFENFPAMIWMTGINTKRNYFNKAWLEFTNRKLEDEVGDSWVESVHPDDYHKYLEVYLRAFNSRSPFETEYRLCSSNGLYRWVLENGKPYYDFSGKFSGYIGTCYDITDRKISEEIITQQITTHQRDLSVLYQVAAITGELLDRKILLDKILTILFKTIHCKGTAIHLFNKDKALCLETSIGLLNESKIFLQMLPLTWGVLEKLKESHDPILIEDLSDNLSFDDHVSSKEVNPKIISFEGHPCLSVSYLGVPILVRDELMGIVSLFSASENEFTKDEIALSSATARHIGLALKSIDLAQKESERMIENERAKLARDLHDSITQSLYSLMLFSTAAQDAAKDMNMEKLDTCLSRISEQSLLASKHLRLLLYELNLDFFEQEGLVKAINYRLNAVERHLGIDVQLQVDINTPISPTLEWDLFFFVNEALTNALKHAQATVIHILIQSNNGDVIVKVSDNGKGFDVEAVIEQGMGLISMRERAANLGGEFLIHSEIKNGTEVGIKVRY